MTLVYTLSLWDPLSVIHPLIQVRSSVFVFMLT